MDTNYLNIGYLNTYHLFNKVTDINVLLTTKLKGTHILGIGETKLKQKKKKKKKIHDTQLSIDNYKIIRRDIEKKGDTGIAIYVHNSVYNKIKRRHDLESKNIESVWLEIKNEHSIPNLICFIYRNPKEPIEWQEDFQTMIENIPHRKYELQIFGDINKDLNKTQHTWNSITTQLGLKQLIKDSTRETDKTSTLLDHIYTNTHDKITNVKVIHTNISDHYALQCSYYLKIKIPKANTKGHTQINYRCYKNFNTNSFLSYLGTLPFQNIYANTDPEIALEFLCNLLRLAIDKHIPIKTKRIKRPEIPAWLSQTTIEAMKLRDSINKKTHKEEFKKQRNLVNHMVKKDKEHFFNKIIEEKKDTASIWKAINILTNSKKKSSNTKIELNPNEINNFFLNISENTITPEIRRLSENFTCPTELEEFCKNKNPHVNFKIPNITIYEVNKLINGLKNTKAIGPDEIPVNILKISLPFILEPLTFVYNLCIDKQYFPSQFKEAKVIPIPKTKDTTHPRNLRPISLLPILSKPLEIHIHKHMNQHLEKNDLLHKYQSGFRKKHSCHTALTNLTDRWLHAINKSELVGTIFLDFKKAFDLVNHNILIDKLKLYFPNSSIVNFTKSYLTNRSQFVSLNGKCSYRDQIKSGVPQGSILGPLLFLIYINDLPLHLNKQTNDLPLHLNIQNEEEMETKIISPLQLNKQIETDLFADDASLNTSQKDVQTVQSKLQKSLNSTHEWCNMNSMVIHPEKTKSMIITTRQKLQITDTTLTLQLGETKIEQVKEHKILGVVIDTELSWNKHVEYIIKKLSTNVFLLSKLKHFIKPKYLKLFFDAHIMSYLTYSSTVWDGCSENIFKQLNSIHRRAVKHLTNNQSLNTDEKLKALNILPLRKHLELKKLLMIHKIYYNQAPHYLTNIITKASTRYYSKNVIIPKTNMDLYKSSLSFSGAILWNRLPNKIKTITSFNSFKIKLKEWLINQKIL